MADDPGTEPTAEPAAEPTGAEPPAAEPTSAEPAAAPNTGTAADWYGTVQDDKLRDHAGRFTSVIDLLGKHYDLRKQLSTAIQPLAGDATDEQVGAYRKALGVPETVDGYEFTAPEGRELTEADTAFQKSAAEMFHSANISTAQAAHVNEWWNEIMVTSEAAKVAQDGIYATESETKLKIDWPGELFDRNKMYANAAAPRAFGEDFEDVRLIETKAGQFILDHPAFVRMLAGLGREMSEGTLGAVMTDGDIDGVQSQIDEMQGKIDKATMQGDRDVAQKLFQQQQDLYRKLYPGNIVGAEGRVV